MSQTAIPAAEPASPQTRKPFDFDALPFSALIVWIVCIVLAAVCNSGTFVGQEWIWTDDALIARNPLIGNINGLQSVWTRMFAPHTYLLPQFSPLSQTMFYFERAIFGDNPLGYRIVSMILHGSCAAVLYLLLRGLRVRGAVIVVLLFVAHPVLVDSVSFLTERRNPLGGLLGLSGMYMLLRASGAIAAPAGRFKFLPEESSRLYAIGTVLLILGLFSQPAIAPLGVVALLIHWARRIRVSSALALIAVGIALLGAALLAVSSRVEIAQSNYTAKQWERAPSAAGEIAVRTQIAGRATFFYLQKSLLPYPLSMDWGRWVTPNDLEQFREVAPDASKERFAQRSPDVGAGVFSAWLFPLAVVVILVGLGLSREKIGRAPLAIAASFLLLLLPFLGFVDLGWMQQSFVSQRAMYLAVIPILLGIVVAVSPLLADPTQRVSMIASIVIVLIVMVRLGVGVSFRYQYNLSFWRESDIAANRAARPILNALTRTPWYSRYQAASSLIQYQPTELPKALEAYNDVLEKIRPGNSEVLVQLGRVLYALRQDQEAMNRFAFVMENDPDYGLAYRSAGDVLRRQAEASPRDPAPRRAALDFYQKAAEADPLDATARVLVGEAAWEIAKRLPPEALDEVKEKMTLAEESFDAADAIRPYDVQQLMREARTFIEMSSAYAPFISAAAQRLQTARAVEPDNVEILLLVADAAQAGAQFKGAESAYRQILSIDEKNLDVYLNYSAMLATQERFDEAQELLDKGLSLMPEEPKLLDAVEKLKKFREDAATRPAGS